MTKSVMRQSLPALIHNLSLRLPTHFIHFSDHFYWVLKIVMLGGINLQIRAILTNGETKFQRC